MTIKSIVESAWAEDTGQFFYHRHPDKKNNKESWKNKIKTNKQTVPSSLTKIAWNIYIYFKQFLLMTMEQFVYS